MIIYKVKILKTNIFTLYLYKCSLHYLVLIREHNIFKKYLFSNEFKNPSRKKYYKIQIIHLFIDKFKLKIMELKMLLNKLTLPVSN